MTVFETKVISLMKEILENLKLMNELNFTRFEITKEKRDEIETKYKGRIKLF